MHTGRCSSFSVIDVNSYRTKLWLYFLFLLEALALLSLECLVLLQVGVISASSAFLIFSAAILLSDLKPQFIHLILVCPIIFLKTEIALRFKKHVKNFKWLVLVCHVWIFVKNAFNSHRGSPVSIRYYKSSILCYGCYGGSLNYELWWVNSLTEFLKVCATTFHLTL